MGDTRIAVTFSSTNREHSTSSPRHRATRHARKHEHTRGRQGPEGHRWLRNREARSEVPECLFHHPPNNWSAQRSDVRTGSSSYSSFFFLSLLFFFPFFSFSLLFFWICRDPLWVYTAQRLPIKHRFGQSTKANASA